MDVWTENGPTANTMHKRICVETKDESTCKAPCKGTPRFCISFAPGDGRGSESTSVGSSRSSNSDTLNIDSSAASEQKGKKKSSPKSNELGLEEGVFAPGITRPTGDAEEDNGHVYIDDGKTWRPWRIWEKNYYLKTTCSEDKAIESYFKSLLGIYAPYQLHWNNCHVFFINTFYEIEKKVEEHRKQK